VDDSDIAVWLYKTVASSHTAIRRSRLLAKLCVSSFRVLDVVAIRVTTRALLNREHKKFNKNRLKKLDHLPDVHVRDTIPSRRW